MEIMDPGSNVPVELFRKEWKMLDEDYAQLKENFTDYKKISTDYHTKQRMCLGKVRKQDKKLKELFVAIQNCDLTEEEKNDYKEKTKLRMKELHEVQNVLPRKNGFYLSLIVGNINMTIDDPKEKHEYKEAYEKFKLYCSLVMFVASFLLSFFIVHRVTDACFCFFLLWYYCTLTVRESILVVNGSRIKGWWLTHHYVSVVLSGINVLWPEGPAYHEFRTNFMYFSIYETFLQFLQFYYQTGCLYRMRALGEGNDMNITVDGFHSWMLRGLSFLLPFIFIGHFWQLYNSYLLFAIAKKYNYEVWQVPAIGLLFFIMFAGNFSTTIFVLIQKFRKGRVKSVKKMK